MAKVRLAKTIEDADAYWAAMTPEQQAAVEEFHGNGASPVHAVNMAITGVTQKMDAARIGTDASESLDPGDSPEMFSDAPGDSRESAIPDVDVPGFGNLRQLSPGEDPFASKAERIGAGGLALANDVSMDIVPTVKKIAAHPIAASGKLAASMIAGGPLGPALFQTAMHNTDADPESAEVLAERDAPGATGSGRLAGDAVNAAMAGAAGPEMARAGSSALEALKTKVGGIKRVGGIVAKSAAEEMGKKVIGRKGMAMLKKVLAEPPESQLAGVDASDLGGTQEGSPNMVPPMDETAVDLTPEMIKRPALENLRAATADPVPDLSRPAPAPTTELNPNADEGNGVLRPDSEFTDEENRTWPRITPEPAINSSPIGRRPPQPTPDTGSGTPQTGADRPGLQRLRQATADQPPKVGTSPAPSTEASSVEAPKRDLAMEARQRAKSAPGAQRADSLEQAHIAARTSAGYRKLAIEAEDNGGEIAGMTADEWRSLAAQQDAKARSLVGGAADAGDIPLPEPSAQPPLSMKPAQRFNLDKMRAVLADLPPEQRQAFLDANAAHGQLQLGPLADENGLQMPAGASPRSTAPAHVKAASAEGAHTPKQWLTGAPLQEGNPAMKAAVDANALGNAPQGPHPLADPVGAFKATGGDVIKVREVMTALQGAGMSNVQIAQLMQQAGVQ